jgi:hypothetical protein
LSYRSGGSEVSLAVATRGEGCSGCLRGGTKQRAKKWLRGRQKGNSEMSEKRIESILLNEFKTQNGRSLASLMESEPLLLVFLRHFG